MQLRQIPLAGEAEAHQPFFEDYDYTLLEPRVIRDPEIATALYATRDRPEDIDYYRCTGKAGQEEFAPMIALLGPDLPGKPLKPPPGEPPAFYEPFTRTSYWTRQNERVILPADGDRQGSALPPEDPAVLQAGAGGGGPLAR